LPGKFIGQAIFYILAPYYEYNIFHSIIHNKNKINNEDKQIYDMYDIVLISIKIYLLYSAGIFQTSVYFFTINLLYFINVYPNHSTYETKIENKYEGNNWAKMQICNSGNFLMDNLWWTRIFGGINYQIEHHLFPNMSNIHYPEVSKIVRAYCKERNIPYVNKETLYDAYKSLEKYVNY
jgi:linoleoyl-CoA desaturase